MRFLLVAVMYLLCGCGSPLTLHGEAQKMRWARQAADQVSLVMHRVSPNKITGKVASEGMVGGNTISPSHRHRPVKELVLTTTPAEWLVTENKQHVALQKIGLIKRDVSLKEAYQHIKQHKTFLHIFFTMRDSVGGDMKLLYQLNASGKSRIDAQTYFDLVQRLQFPNDEQLHQIIAGVATSKGLRKKFLVDLHYAANVEAAIEQGALYHQIGRRTVRNTEINTSLRQRLHKLRTQAERDIQLKMLQQPEMAVKHWLRRGSITNELLLEMQELVGGRKELAALLDMQEAILRSCMRRGANKEKAITNIITKLRSSDGHPMLKPFAAKLEASLAMEKAIDAGAVVLFGLHHQKILAVDAVTLRGLQQTLYQRRLVFSSGKKVSRDDLI